MLVVLLALSWRFPFVINPSERRFRLGLRQGFGVFFVWGRRRASNFLRCRREGYGRRFANGRLPGGQSGWIPGVVTRRVWRRLIRHVVRPANRQRIGGREALRRLLPTYRGLGRRAPWTEGERQGDQ